VAMDHGLMGRPESFRNPRRLIEQIIAANPDGLLLTAGMAALVADLLSQRGAPALIVSRDQVIHERDNQQGLVVAHAPVISIEEALRIGADAVKAILVLGGVDRAAQAENLAYLAATAEECRYWQMPLIVEPYLWGPNVPDDPHGRADFNANGARMALEVGADILKVEYGGEREAFREMVEASPVPVFVMGGPKRPTQREMLADVVDAADAGAVGLTIGRNVWQHPEPAKMVRALRIALAGKDLHGALAELA
jgi:class I fructose-bisphosphate aldolase